MAKRRKTKNESDDGMCTDDKMSFETVKKKKRYEKKFHHEISLVQFPFFFIHIHKNTPVSFTDYTKKIQFIYLRGKKINCKFFFIFSQQNRI